METLKRKYGWAPELEEFLKNSNKQLLTDYSGSFYIRKVSGKLYWYYRLSADVKRRDKYLSAVEPKDKPAKMTSFQYACDILLKKLQSQFTISSRDKRFLAPYTEYYLDHITDTTAIKRETKKGTSTAIKDFKSYCINHNIKLHIVPTNEMKQVYKDYIQHLWERQMARSTIKMYAQKVRYFFEWLVLDKFVDGLGLFPSQPITLPLQQALLNKVCGHSQPRPIKQFRTEHYKAMYKDCYGRIREIWNDYCDSGGVLPRIIDKNGKINQPPHFLA